MLTSKPALLKALNLLRPFENGKASAYLGVQWGSDGLLFHRSGDNGYMQSVGYRGDQPPALVVFMSHLKECLNNLQDERVDVREDSTGIMTLVGSSNGFRTELRVHTIRPTMSWRLTHDAGPKTVELPADVFKGIKVDCFTATSQPVLRRNSLMILTDSGVVARNEVPVEAYPYPRDSFLRSAATLSIDQMYMTQGGFWVAVGGGFEVVVSGHRKGDDLFDAYNRASQPLAEMPGARLVQALHAASNLSERNFPIQIDPLKGVIVRDEFSHNSVFSLGLSKGWSAFCVSPKTASTIADALGQSADETAHLSLVNPTTFRISRGAWQVTFGVTRAVY